MTTEPINTVEPSTAADNKRKLEVSAVTEDTGVSKQAKLETSTLYEKFSTGLFDSQNRDAVRSQIASSEPYKHGVIPTLMNDQLLRKVRQEVMENLHFTKKETDIYKVFQTGDLRNLSGLDKAELSKLQSLFELREALYSPEFREYMSYVTGCGALSGTKQDLSINVYQKGCQLLTHDDVIGSRRISYILYLPDPDEHWEYPKNGGALRLYPVEKPNVPAKDWTLVIPPSWNQLAFFTVQPGLSFHDVEEVFVDKERMSISGWFHIPQKGENGFIEGELEATEARSSLQQLESDEVQEYDYPKKNYELINEAENKLEETKENDQETPLQKADFDYLAQYMNPTLLKSESMKMLSQYFCDESALEIRDFLNATYAKLVQKAIDDVDIDSTPQASSEVDALPFWKLAGPPHKTRYMYLDGRESYDAELTKKDDGKPLFSQLLEDTTTSGITPADKKLAEISVMLQSSAFRNWLRLVSALNPVAQRILVRRFRPGLDYTLATSSASQSKDADDKAQHDTGLVLEGTLCLTPTKGWDDGEIGGYELCMMSDTPEEGEDLDPAVYRGSSTSSKKNGYGAGNADDDDAVLFSCQAEWNVLSLVVRDPGILKFVKYVSGNAPGSRWDIAGEWPVENNDEDDDDDDDENKNDAN